MPCRPARTLPACATLFLSTTAIAAGEAHRWLFNEPAGQTPNHTSTHADDHAESPVPIEPDYRVRLEPAAWFAGLAGEVQLPGSDLTLDFDDLNLDSTGVRPAAEATVLRGPWRVTLRGFSADEEGTTTATFAGSLGNVAFVPGDVLRSEVSMASVELEGGYRFDPFALGKRSDGDPVDVESWFELVGGARIHSFDFDFAVEGGGNQGESRLLAEPIVGSRWAIEIDRQFTVDVTGTVGGFALDGDTYAFSVDVIVGGTWRINPNAGVQIGYRQLVTLFGDGEGDDEFVGRSSAAGLYIGADFRF